MFTSLRIEITDLKIIINNEHDYLVNFMVATSAVSLKIRLGDHVEGPRIV
jgi:hypothetical protein